MLALAILSALAFFSRPAVATQVTAEPYVPGGAETSKRLDAKTDQGEDHYDVATLMVNKTMGLYTHHASTWPVKIVIGHGGSLPVTRCGPTPAAYCRADNTIALSSDLLYDAINKSPLAVSLIVGHELAHSIIMKSGIQPRHNVLHELMADCMSGAMMGQAFGTLPVDQLATIKDLAKFTHSSGDPFYWNPDHHGFGAQRFIAFYVGLESGIRFKYGEQSHANDCVAFFGD